MFPTARPGQDLWRGLLGLRGDTRRLRVLKALHGRERRICSSRSDRSSGTRSRRRESFVPRGFEQGAAGLGGGVYSTMGLHRAQTAWNMSYDSRRDNT